MGFIYDENAKEHCICVEQNAYKHLKARRIKQNDIVNFSNLLDGCIYEYELVELNKKNATFMLKNSFKTNEQQSDFQLAWSVVDPLVIEKTLPILNEMGLSKIAFIYAQYSQKNFKIDYKRLKRILINSSEQCGRNNFMQFEEYQSIEEYLKTYPQSFILDFNGTSDIDHAKSVIIGCEGGFSKNERELFGSDKVVGLKANYTLRSQTAAICCVSKKLLYM